MREGHIFHSKWRDGIELGEMHCDRYQINLLYKSPKSKEIGSTKNQLHCGVFHFPNCFQYWPNSISLESTGHLDLCCDVRLTDCDQI